MNVKKPIREETAESYRNGEQEHQQPLPPDLTPCCAHSEYDYNDHDETEQSQGNKKPHSDRRIFRRAKHLNAQIHVRPPSGIKYSRANFHGGQACRQRNARGCSAQLGYVIMARHLNGQDVPDVADAQTVPQKQAYQDAFLKITF
jgi:hypothetical protein